MSTENGTPEQLSDRDAGRLTFMAVALLSRLRTVGGYTVAPHGGEAPSVGFAVSVPNFERKYSIALIRPTDIVDGLNDAMLAPSVLGVRDDFYAGAWHDTDSGLVYLDTSIVVRDRWDALEFATRWGQLAVYDLTSTETVHVSKLTVAS